MRNRWLTLIPLLLAALWAPFTSRASGDPPINSYTVVALGELGGGNGSTAWALNDAGQVVGSSRPPITGVSLHAFLWENGVMRDLGTLGGRDSEARAINNAGQVVGWAMAPGYRSPAFLWDATGGMRDLGTLGGNVSLASGINDAGQVVGWSLLANGQKHAFLWQNGRMVDLGVPAGFAWSEAGAINASGQVAGTVGTADYGRSQAFLWTPDVPNGTAGTMVLLDSLVYDWAGSVAYGINGSAAVVGEMGPHDYGGPVRWDSGHLHALPLLPDTTVGSAAAINGARFVVGINQYWQGGDPDDPYSWSGWVPLAFVWDEARGTRALSALMSEHVYLSYAHGINALGQIAADGYVLTPSPLPIRPSLQAPASIGDTRVTLSWSPSSGADYYAVKRSTASGGPYTRLASVTGSSYTDMAVVNGTTYYYVVSALNAFGESPNSDAVDATPKPPPAPPTALTAVAGDRQVSLSWNPSAGADYYDIGRSTTAGGPYDWIDYTVTASYLDSGTGRLNGTPLQNGIRYYYVVMAGNAAGFSGTSNEASATPAVPPPPPTPTGLAATPGDMRVTLSWNASPGATYYQLKRATISGGPYAFVGSLGGTSYIDSGLANGRTYYYMVSAVNSGGESPDSRQVSATLTGPLPPAAPTRLTATAGKKKVTLTWTQSRSAGVIGNRLYRSTTSGGPYSLHSNLGAVTSFTDGYVTSGVTYYYVVTAVSSSGKESTYSNQASAKPR